MDEVEIVATYDSEDTAREVAKAVNNWIGWLLEGDPEDIPDLFEDFGLATDDYAIDRDDIDWSEPPRVRARGANVVIALDGSATLDAVQELLEALGAYDVFTADDEEE